MSGASAVTTAPAQFELGGKWLQINNRILKYLGEAEQVILARRSDPFKLARDNAELFKDQPEMQKELVRLAMVEATTRSNFVTRLEIARWLDTTLDGAAFALYLAVRENDRQFYTFEKVRELFLDELDDVAAKNGQAAVEQRIQQAKDAIDQAARPST
jgi:hypothetical protein